MEMLLGVGAVWFAAAAAVTFGLGRAAAAERPFRAEERGTRALVALGPR